MKKTITLFFLFVAIKSVNAQKILLSQDFNSFPGYFISGWTHHYTGAVPWQAGEPYLVGECIGPLMAPTGIANTNHVAAIADCGWDYNNSSVLMFTPLISLAADTGAWISYDSYFGKYTSGSYTEKATVEVSTDTGKTWTVIQDVPANPSLNSFTKYYISLSAFNHAPAIWIGFRYNDDGGHMMGWAIDNVKVFVPTQKDIALVSVTPLDTMLGYVTINTGYSHFAQVMNMGNDTITSFLLNYRQDASGPIYAQYVTGVSLPRFATYNFMHHIPDTVLTQGKHNIAVWATLIGDSISYNDSANVVLHGAYFMPEKKSLVEEGTSTQNGYCPKDYVLMNNTPAGLDLCKVSIHFGDTDAMHLTYYDDSLYYLHFPNNEYIYVDRKRILPDLLNDVVNYQKDYFGFADLILDPVIAGDSLTMNVTLKPAIDMTGDFRLAMVITEDHVTGTDTQYAQRNFYSGGGRGPMGGFETKPNPVPASDMVYNFVARIVSPYQNPIGIAGIIPSTTVHNTNYNYTLGAKLSSSWQHNKLKAVVMLLRNNDTTALNSNETQWYLGVPVNAPGTLTAFVYPNPANEYTNLVFTLTQSEKLRIDITDMAGRKLYTHEGSYNAGENKLPLQVQNLSPGMYLISLVEEDRRQTLKLEVLK